MRFSSQSSYSDEEIIQGVSQGGAMRERFISILFRRFRGYIYKGATEFRLSHDEARDAYTDAIINVTRHIEQDRFRGESSLATYLYTAFQNRCRDKLRRESKDQQAIEWVDEMSHLPEKARDILSQLIDREEVEALQQLLGSLGDTCREILLLSEYHGYTLDEIAERIGFENANSVSSKKYRCMEQLRKLIREKRGESGE